MCTLQAPGSPAVLGVLMLETRFPRPPGDVGNPATFPHPVVYRTVAGAGPAQIVAPADRARAHLPAFAAAARELVSEGATAITTSCGFLVLAQDELAAAVPVPVISSALLLAPLIGRLRPGVLGIVTAHAGHLGMAHLMAAGIAPGQEVMVRGMEGCAAFADGILGNADTLDTEAVAAGLIALCQRMQAEEPRLSAILLECTNLPPYAAQLRAATGLPVWGLPEAVALAISGQFTTT